MGIYLAGVDYAEVHVGGAEFTKLQAGGAEYHAAETDVPGTLTLEVSRSGSRVDFDFSITDPNGIRSVTAATLTARDNTVANILSDFSRSNANTFAGTDRRTNNRWRRGTLTVTYVDNASGARHTLTQTWTV